MPEPTPVGARVEIVEPFTANLTTSLHEKANALGQLPCVKPRRVRINGTDVGLMLKGSLVVDAGLDGQAATVTLTLLAKSIEIKAE